MRGLWSQHFSPPPPASQSHSPPVAKTWGLGSQYFKPEEAPSPLPPDGYERCVLCPTCSAACSLLTSRTDKNPGRQFYTCKATDHKFFKWADSLNPPRDLIIDVPYCGGCNAGVCRVRREKTGPNVYRIQFLCTIKEGEGSCGYKVWQDEYELSLREASEGIASSPLKSANSHENNVTYVDTVEENLPKDYTSADSRSYPVDSAEHLEAIGTPSESSHPIDVAEHLEAIGTASESSHPIDAAEHLQGIGTAPERIEEIAQTDNSAYGKMEQLKFHDGKPRASSRRPSKRSRHGNPKGFRQRNSLVIPSSLVSVSSGTPALHLAENSASIRHCWMTAAINQNLSTELQGWWGRLAFQPMPNLIVRASCNISSVTIDSYSDEVFVNFDGPIIISRKCLEFQTLNSPQVCNASLTTTIPSQVALDVPSTSINFPKTKFNITMGESISKAFDQVAVDLKNKFITLLETTDVHDHELMSQEAEVTFSALDCLKFDHQELKEHTMEFIHQAMELSEIKRSILDIESHKRLLEQYSGEKTRLDEISRIHAETHQTLTRKQNHVNELRENIASTKSWLVEIEKEFSIREAELKDMERDWERISQDKEILEEKCLMASKEFEESEKLHQQKKAQHDVAEAAFNRARALLQGHI